MKLNIGCGRDYRAGWINIDISKDARADSYLDIRKQPLQYSAGMATMAAHPIMPGSVDEIYISGVLEQILENEDLIFAMNECHRVLKEGGVMRVIVPNAAFAIAHQDPMDVRKFTKPTFAYFLKGDRHHELYGSVYGFRPWAKLVIDENDRHILTVTMIK